MIETVIFDLDGTVYQNLTFHADYLHFLLEGTPFAALETPLLDYINRVFCGERLVMNSYYTAVPLDTSSLDAYLTSLEAAHRPDMTYDLALDNPSIVYLGDAWAVLALIGRTLGILDEATSERVYRATRAKMSRDGLAVDQRLKRAIQNLNTRFSTVLLSNSYAQTALDFLHQLTLDDVFGDYVFSADKPRSMVQNVTTLCPDLPAHPDRFLVIGDHVYNDLIPMQRLGCPTVWINPYPKINEPEYDTKVKSTDELAARLEQLLAKQ